MHGCCQQVCAPASSACILPSYRAQQHARFRPYDLVVVGRQEVGSDYFTMSATGVMHVVQGCQVG